MSRDGAISVASLAATLLACGQGPIELSSVIGPDVEIAGPEDRPFAGGAQIVANPNGEPDLYVLGGLGPSPLWRVPRTNRAFGAPKAVHDSALSGLGDLGDVDGDGKVDLGLVAWRDDRAWASYGHVGAAGYVRTSPWELETVGFFPQLVGIGDWTRNGYLDVALHLSDAANPARTVVLEGSPVGPTLPPVWSDDRFRWNILGAMDSDGDGRSEMLLNAGGGRSMLLRFRDDGSADEETLIIDGAFPGGDVDGDGRSDISRLVHANADQRGAVELYLGPVDDPDPWWRLETWAPCSENVANRSTCFEGDRFRNIWSLDFNGDGRMDVLVSAIGPSELMSRGVAAIFEGRKGRPPRKTPTWVLAAVDDDRFFRPTHSGDLDGDGMDDVVAVASGCDNPLACDPIGGTVYVFFGREERP